MDRQLSHHEARAEPGHFPLCVVCDQVEDPLNVGAVFRMADAMGVSRILLCGSTPTPPHPRIARTARSTQQQVPFTYFSDTATALAQLRHEAFHIVGLERSAQSISITNFDFSAHEKIALVIGSEKHGLGEETLRQVDAVVHIPMFGHNSSMNVVQALGIALFEVVRQWGKIRD